MRGIRALSVAVAAVALLLYTSLPLLTPVPALAAAPQCSDGIDNDNDGAIDFPADFSCSSLIDTDESLPRTECQDGEDNDGDDLKDKEDPGCHIDRNAANPLSYHAQRNDETNTAGLCSDAEDNDDDTLTDAADPECHTDGDPRNPYSFDGGRNETRDQRIPLCQDGRDNDGDGYTDYPQDRGCSAPDDTSEGNADKVTVEMTTGAARHVAPGQTIVYTITLRNTGSAAQEDIRLQQNLPAALQFVSANPTGYNRYDGIVLWSRMDVPARATITLTLVTRVRGDLQPGDQFQTVLLVNNTEAARSQHVIREGGVRVARPTPGSPYAVASGWEGAGTYGTSYAPGIEGAYGAPQIMPRTGIGDFLRPLENTTRFLLPLDGDPTAASTALLWLLLACTGLGLGAVGARKYPI